MQKYFAILLLVLLGACSTEPEPLKINDKEYFERQGVNVLVYNNLFSGGFNDEKNSGLEIIHHGVRTAQGGAIRLSNTPEQWDLVPKTTNREVDAENNTIEVGLRYDDYDFDARLVVVGEGEAFMFVGCNNYRFIGNKEQVATVTFKTADPSAILTAYVKGIPTVLTPDENGTVELMII